MASLKCQPSSINQSSARNNNGRSDGAAFMGLTHGYRQQHLRVALTQEEKARLGVCRRISHAGRAQEAEKESEWGGGGSHLVDVLLQKEKEKKMRKTPLAKRKIAHHPMLLIQSVERWKTKLSSIYHSPSIYHFCSVF